MDQNNNNPEQNPNQHPLDPNDRAAIQEAVARYIVLRRGRELRQLRGRFEQRRFQHQYQFFLRMSIEMEPIFDQAIESITNYIGTVPAIGLPDNFDYGP